MRARIMALRGVAAGVAALCIGGQSLGAVVGVDFQTNPLIFGCQTTVTGCVLGYSFSVTQQVSIVSLGVFSSTVGNPLARSHEIGLWDSGNNLVASVTLNPSTPDSTAASASGLGQWLFESISPLTLNVGSYSIATHYTNTQDETFYSAGEGLTATGIVLGRPLQEFAPLLTRPTVSLNTTRFGYFGPSFQLASPPSPPTSVPEPGSAPLALLALAAATLALRATRPAATGATTTH